MLDVHCIRAPKKVAQALALSALDFEQVEDSRAHRHPAQLGLGQILTRIVLCLASGLNVLRAMEQALSKLSPRLRRKLEIGRRDVSDTCLYETLKRTSGAGCRLTLVRQVKDALARKEIQNDLFAGGVMSFDGKKTAHGNKVSPKGDVVRTFWGKKATQGWMFHVVRACLTSSSARPVVDQEILSNRKGESAGFKEILPRVCQLFPRLFRYLTADAAYTSAANAILAFALNKYYLFALKGNQKTLLTKAQLALEEVDWEFAQSELYNGYTVRRQLRRVAIEPSVSFPHAVQFVQLHQVKRHRNTGALTVEDRYWVSSIPLQELSAERWLKLIRLHWGIEDGANWTCDVIFREDTQFPCRQGFGPSIMSWLLLLAYNLVSILRTLGHQPKKGSLPFTQVIREVWAMVFGRAYAQWSFDNI